ncbi:RHS repeat-associated core domain-containing protein [Labrys sp. 22185]|uniref:RHS repeat-associated core domain-containing protein n=1 Tax=Labrys sp. 22185 TaxID=3453888 RepID=UPI003F871404
MADGTSNDTSSQPTHTPVIDLGAQANDAAQTAKRVAAPIPGQNTTVDENKNAKATVNSDATQVPDLFYCPESDYKNAVIKAAEAVKAEERSKFVEEKNKGGIFDRFLMQLGANSLGGSGQAASINMDTPTAYIDDDEIQYKLGMIADYDAAMQKAKEKGDAQSYSRFCQEKNNINENTDVSAALNRQRALLIGLYLAIGVAGAVASRSGGKAPAIKSRLPKESRFNIIFQKLRLRPSNPANTAVKPPNTQTLEAQTPTGTNTQKSSTPNNPSTAGEPVSVTSGEYLETWQDFQIPGAALALDGARHMGLKLPMPTRWRNPLGASQISAFDEFIANPRRGELEFHQADGKIVTFERPFNFLPSINSAFPHLELRAPWLGQLALKDKRIVKHFAQYDDRFYRLEKVEDLNGNALTFTRSETGLLERVESSDGLTLAFDNDEEGHRLSIALIGTDGSTLELVRYAYDSRGRMTSADCSFGMSVRYCWHATKPLLEHWHNLTRRSETVFSYDREGRVVHTATNGIWNDDRFCYDSDKRETTYLPAGEEARAQRFEYDEFENVTTETDALGGAVSHRYDQVGQRISTIDANGNATATRYDIRGNICNQTDAEGRSTIYGWGPNGDIDIIIDGAGGVRKFENDRFGNMLAMRDAEKHETRFERDERGRLTKTIFADGADETRTYDEYGRLAQIRDAKGGLTCFSYDVFGRLIERVDALGGVTKLTYEAGAGGFAVPTRLTRPDGVSINRRFDAEGSLASVTDGEGRSWTYRFGAFELLEAITDPKGGELSFVYDSEGRLSAVTNAMGRVYSLRRDVAGRVIEEEDFDGRVIRYRRDPGGRVVEKIKSDGARLVYSYDKTDRVTRIEAFSLSIKPEDSLIEGTPQDVTRFWYDGRGLIIKAENRASLIEYERDRNGAVVAETINGRRVAVKLDAMGRRIERRLSAPNATNLGESLVSYSHDPLGAIKSITIDSHAPLFFQHDALGRETRRSSPTGFQLTSRHDAVGQLIEQIGGRDPAERTQYVTFGEATSYRPAHAIERCYRWDRASSPLTILDGLWGETSYQYDTNGQVEATKAGEGTGDELRESFAYDAACNLVGAAAAGADKLYGFGESLGKLTTWSTTPGGLVQIARGPRGERLALSHDQCGRVIERKVERKGFRTKVWRYDWDGYDRLVKCLTPEGDIWRYGYDPFGRRVWKVRELTQPEARGHASRFPDLIATSRITPDYASSLLPPPAERRSGLPGQNDNGRNEPPIVGIAYSWDGDAVAEEAPLRLDGSILWHRSTRWYQEPGSFRPLAKQEASRPRQVPDGSWKAEICRLLYIVTDHLGTPREMLSEHGKIEWAASYTTWGTILGLRCCVPKAHNDDYPGSSGPVVKASANGPPALKPAPYDSPQVQDCPIRFLGQWQDDETGLYYNRYRHYDPLAGQYISPDPIGLEGGGRPQAYVANSLAEVDPLGLAAEALPNRTFVNPQRGADIEAAIAGKVPHKYDNEQYQFGDNTATNNQMKKWYRDIKVNGVGDRDILYVKKADGTRVIVWGNNRYAIARSVGRTNELNFYEIQPPFRGYKSMDDVIPVSPPQIRKEW